LANRRIIPINRPSVNYIRAQLDTEDCARTKWALQYLCKLYRTGHRISPDELLGIEQTIVGILYSRRQDEKVRRWALNALAQFGRRDISLNAVLDLLKDVNDDPQTAAAAIAAIYRMQPNETQIISSLGMFDPQVRVLARIMQHRLADVV
jgi:hypothetical protein